MKYFDKAVRNEKLPLNRGKPQFEQDIEEYGGLLPIICGICLIALILMIVGFTIIYNILNLV